MYVSTELGPANRPERTKILNVKTAPSLVMVNMSPDCEFVLANPLSPLNVIVEVPLPLKYDKRFCPLRLRVYPEFVNV